MVSPGNRLPSRLLISFNLIVAASLGLHRISVTYNDQYDKLRHRICWLELHWLMF